MRQLGTILFLLACPATVFAQPLDLALHERTVGHWRGGMDQSGIDCYPSPTGGLSVVRLLGRVDLPAGVLEPRAASSEGTFVLVHDRSGAIRSARPVRVDGEDLRSSSVALDDGGALVLGSAGQVPADPRAAIARVGPDGAVLWAWRATNLSPRSCDPSRQMCAFSHFEHAVARGDRAWIVGDFRRGELRLPGGRVLRGRRYLNAALIEVDLASGAIRWARSVVATSEVGLVLDGDRLVLSSGTRAGAALAIHSIEGGRQLRTVPLPIRTAPVALVEHGGGLAMLFEDGWSWALIGLARDGRLRFRQRVSRYSALLADGQTLYVASPLREERRGGAPLEGMRVTSLDTGGHPLGLAVDDAGQWARGTVGLERARGGGVALGGVAIESGAPRLVVRRPGAHEWVHDPPRTTPERIGPAVPPPLFTSSSPVAPFSF